MMVRIIRYIVNMIFYYVVISMYKIYYLLYDHPYLLYLSLFNIVDIDVYYDNNMLHGDLSYLMGIIYCSLCIIGLHFMWTFILFFRIINVFNF